MTNRIMVVGDESLIGRDIQQRLDSLGHKVAGFADSEDQAVHMVAELAPELIILDSKLHGGIDGIEVAKRIRSFSDVPIIYLTEFADEPTLGMARLTGAFGYLIKPFDNGELGSAIDLALYKHSMERKLTESEERYALAVRAANDGIWDWNLKTNEIYFSPRWKEILGYQEDEIGNDPEDWFKRIHPDHKEQVQANLVAHIKGFSRYFECEYRMQHSNGKYIWVLSRGLAARIEQEPPYRMAGSQSDISARKFAEERLLHGALHDTLTGLPNRGLFIDRLENRLAQVKRNPDVNFAVMFIDLDRFKVVNDSLGHDVGDQLLITVAFRLRQCLRPEDTVSRLSGDEFAILINDIKEVGDAIKVADRIRAGLMTTTILENIERSPTASVGIALFKPGYAKPGDMLRDADLAMYRAKAMGGNRYQLFDESMHTTAVELIKLEGELKRAIVRQELLVDYQPIVAIVSGQIVGVEALVRWKHPQRGIIPPLGFIHVAEDTGLILPIGEFVLRTACKQAKIWRDAGHVKTWVSVNLSARQFQDQNLVEKIKGILEATGLPGEGLRLEITESVAINDIDYTIRILNELDKVGVYTSLDDFGTGYSSLNYLKRFPFKSLKIDQSFIQEIQTNKKGESITAAIISMARSLDLEVIAEGVEKDEQLAFLRLQFCDNVQGYLVSYPISASALNRVLNLNANPGQEKPPIGTL